MKKIFKNISILSLFLIALSCSDADKEVDGVFDGTTAGGLLRTIEINGTVVQTGVVFYIYKKKNFDENFFFPKKKKSSKK